MRLHPGWYLPLALLDKPAVAPKYSPPIGKPMLLALQSTNLFLLGLTMLVAVLLRWWIKASTRRRAIVPAAAAQGYRPPSHALDAPRDVGRWEVYMHELARDLSGTLDSKIAIIERLLIEADQRIEKLEGIVAKLDELAAGAVEAKSSAVTSAASVGPPPVAIDQLPSSGPQATC